MPASLRVLIVVAALSAAACGGDGGTTTAPARAPSTESPPNVILISVDSLRADHLGCYGYDRATSPSLDRLASEGVLFEVAVSSTSWTLPAHAAMFTALPDSVHAADRTSSILVPERRTLAEHLKEAGYRTAGFWSGPYLHPRFGLAQGFDDYVGCVGYRVYAEESIRSRDWGPAGRAFRGQLRADSLSHDDVTSPLILEKVGAWLEEADERPFFLFIHMWDVHFNYIPPPPYDTMFTDPDYSGPVDGRNLSPNVELQEEGLPPPDLEHLIALYDGEIAWTDRHIGLLLERVEEMGLKENTAVIVTADHGEEFFEHGKFGHRKKLYEESIRIPLIVRLPGKAEPGRRVRELARMVDIAPTVLEITGAAPLPDVMGRSLVGALSGAAPLATETALAELVRPRRGDAIVAVRTDDWKLVVQSNTGKPIGLWNLAADPGEQVGLLRQDQRLKALALQRHEEMRERLEELRAVHPAPRERPDSLPPELERQLRSLGYID